MGGDAVVSPLFGVLVPFVWTGTWRSRAAKCWRSARAWRRVGGQVLLSGICMPFSGSAGARPGGMHILVAISKGAQAAPVALCINHLLLHSNRC